MAHYKIYNTNWPRNMIYRSQIRFYRGDGGSIGAALYYIIYYYILYVYGGNGSGGGVYKQNYTQIRIYLRVRHYMRA